jgi:hypothetical protein
MGENGRRGPDFPGAASRRLSSILKVSTRDHSAEVEVVVRDGTS